jgi:hypothetical protein
MAIVGSDNGKLQEADETPAGNSIAIQGCDRSTLMLDEALTDAEKLTFKEAAKA